MASTSPSDIQPPAPQLQAVTEHVQAPSLLRNRLLGLLDGFLSESLRSAPASELVRYRIMSGAALLLFLGTVLYALSGPPLALLLAMLASALGFLLTLVLLRRATSPLVPARMLCGVLLLALIIAVFVSEEPLGGIHASIMLFPALAVYLTGVRAGFVLTVVLLVVLGIIPPLHFTSSHPGPLLVTQELLWSLHASAALCLLGAWALGALNITAREEAEASVERTLRELRESQSKLSSLFESTDDMICSLDLEGRLVAANSAMRRAFLMNYDQQPCPGQHFFSVASPERQMLWKQRLEQVSRHQHLRFEEDYVFKGARITLELSLSPIVGEQGHVTGVTLLSRDITARREADARMGDMHRTLVDVSRQAGMAEIATGVLHNVGNTLNSVNISTNLLGDLLRQSRLTGLTKAVHLLREHSADLGTFLTADPQGQKLPAYLFALSERLAEEREAMNKEVLALSESVDHIKSVVSMQQRHARTAGTQEQLEVPQLIDEALRLHAVSFERLGIRIERDYATVPPILVDRHRLLQILINLLSNARHALVESQQQDKRLVIRVHPAAEGASLRIEVADNGLGISPENLPRIFTQGFTTKKTGHGFGLHISALAATDMRGQLSCTSPGPGQGATFSLELPLAGEEASS